MAENTLKTAELLAWIEQRRSNVAARIELRELNRPRVANEDDGVLCALEGRLSALEEVKEWLEH
jgi:hypothetical protein